MRALTLVLLPLIGGCSFVINNYQECSSTSDCAAGRICVEQYCVVPAGCGPKFPQNPAANSIPIGAILPITSGGDVDESERQGQNALVLAMEEVNQRDGVGGRPFALYVCDTLGDRNNVKDQATWLTDAMKAPAVIVAGSANTLVATSITIPRGVVTMSNTASSPEITKLDDRNGGPVGLVWRTAPSDVIQGRIIANLFRGMPPTPNNLSAAAKVAVLYVDDPYGQGLSQIIVDEFQTMPEKSLFPVPYPRRGNVENAVTVVNALIPDITVLIGFPDDAVRILNAALKQPNLTRAHGHQWFFTDSAKDLSLFTDLFSTLEIDGNLGTAPSQGTGSAYPSFRSRFRTRFSVNPDDYAYTSHSYDAFYLIALAAAHAVGPSGGDVTGARIAVGLTKLSSGTLVHLTPSGFTEAKVALTNDQPIDVEGASGSLAFDNATGDAPSPIELWKVSGRGFTKLQDISPP